LGPEGGRPSRPTQAVRHTYSGNLGIVKIFKLYHISKNPSGKKIDRKMGPLANGALCLSTAKHSGGMDRLFQFSNI